MAAITRHRHQVAPSARRDGRCDCCSAVAAAHTPAAPCVRCGHYAAFQTTRFAPAR